MALLAASLAALLPFGLRMADTSSAARASSASTEPPVLAAPDTSPAPRESGAPTELSLPTQRRSSPASPTTVVSLTYDDGNADQLLVQPAMRAAGLVGTYYVASGLVDTPSYMTRAEVTALAAAGNEIGGHTVNHLDLAPASPDEVLRQICLDRGTLSGWGLPVTSFAYPYASVDEHAEEAAAQCGYNSARGLGDIASRFGCADCPQAESFPPDDPYYLKALNQVDATWTLQDLQNAVLDAEDAGGGWVILTFHVFCDCDNPLGVSPALFAGFADWLGWHLDQEQTTAVRTVDEVIGGAVRPPVVPPAPPSVAGAMANGSLEMAGPAGLPSCWASSSFGDNESSVATVSPGRSGDWAVQLSITRYADGAVTLLPRGDAGECAPTAAAGRAYRIDAWYRGSGEAQLSLYYRAADGGFRYWTSGPSLPRSATWTQASAITPPLPQGATGFAFGLSLASAGDLVVDDFTIEPAATR